MDLVDIDKVLDDLEFNESTINVSGIVSTIPTSTAAITAVAENQEISQLSNNTTANESINQLEHNNIHDFLSTTATNEVDGYHSHLPNVPYQNSENLRRDSLDDSTKNKKIVTVSNVFSSLDDYRRDVESLQQQQNFKSDNENEEQQITTDTKEETVLTSLKHNDGKIDDWQQQHHHHHHHHHHHQKSQQNEDDDNTEDEQEDIGCTASSSSITTSSPSSFSSGPSPGSPSESCSFVLGNDNNNKDSIENDGTDIDDNNGDNVSPGMNDKEARNSKDKYETKNNANTHKFDDKEKRNHQEQQQQQQVQQQNDVGNKENSELGLSSISSYLYCENVSSSLPCSSQDMKFDVLSSISSSQTTQNFDKNNDDKEKKKQKSSDDYDDDDSVVHASHPPQKQQQKIVGFGSTMDEISDTELDSILQEIDNDFQMYYVPPTVMAPTATSDDTAIATASNTEKSTSTVSKLPLSSLKSSNMPSDDNEGGRDSLINAEKLNTSSLRSENDELKADRGAINASSVDNEVDKGGISSSQQYPQTVSVEDDNNLQNADSFSQASTIEFADLCLQTDFDVDINDDKSVNAATTNSNTVSDQTVELAVSTSGAIDNEFDLKSTNKDNSIVSKSLQQRSENTDDNMKEEQDCSVTQHLQRPNSLDLPTQMDVKMYINSTAGQTPPASRLDDISLLSTSSSDDQQLSSSEQFGALPTTYSQQQQEQLTTENSNQSQLQDNKSILVNKQQLGKVPPFWIPDSEAPACMQCKQKFSIIKRRHHCRACGQVLCSVCCSQKAKLAFLGNTEARICIQCSFILNERKTNEASNNQRLNLSSGALAHSSSSTSDGNLQSSDSSITSAGATGGSAVVSQAHRSPNPNNPMEYCSMISPYQQVGQQIPSSPISVMVPVGVLKREGAPKNTRKDKNVIFSDGIRPGCDLTELDNSWGTTTNSSKKTNNNSNSNDNNNEFINNAIGGNSNSSNDNNNRNNSSNNNNSSNSTKQQQQQSGSRKIQTQPTKTSQRNVNKNIKSTTSTSSTSTLICNETESYIPKEANNLPPICVSNKTEFEYKDVQNNAQLIERLQNEKLKFVVQRNFFIHVKIVKLRCCVNKTIINFTTEGMHHVGQDEIIILLEIDNSDIIPKDIFIHLNEIYKDADHGYPISELGFSIPKETNFLGSREHGGFLYIRSTFQCLQEIYLPESPFLIGILIHRWEVPWAKIFPLRLMLRLGAEYRYYPSPHISIRGRNSVYAEIAQTIINFLADFRNYSYTLATIKGMYVHMEDRKTSILIPKNRYDQIIKALNNSSDHILALGANFSKKADGHLVCIQNMEADCPETHTYSTQAINIQGQARKVTGASFIVFNGALKSTSGLTGKCNIVEDGLMVQILPTKMQAVRNALKNLKDIDIICGPNDVDESQTEVVSIKWTANDTEFNIGVKSPIDGKRMDSIPSIRVHSGLNYSNKNHMIKWTEVFVLQYDEESVRSKDPIDISKISEQIAKSTSVALLSFLDLLATSGHLKIGLRATLHQENVCYEAGSKSSKLPPLYMNALDNELIPILHKQATSLDVDTPVTLELIFHILNK